MNELRRGTIHLFSIFGIDLYLHWSWFLVAAFEISDRASRYSSPVWNILEYLALFFIVMLHEYGHALACRQVGGQADRIVLWPLGGVAYVNPPMRPGATLWSIAAGPLVNVVLAPILVGLALIARPLGWAQELPNAYAFIQAVAAIDIGLFVFNMLPVYPLDGGKILWSLLWFVMGRARSLMVATVIGFIGAAGLIVLAFTSGSAWLGIMCAFLLLNCWTGMKAALALSRRASLPRRHEFACPSCKSAPLIGAFWVCPRCGNKFDTFASNAVCPGCGAAFASTGCLECGSSNPMGQWIAPGQVVTSEVLAK
jgi:Zn-dependent protease